MGTRRKRKPGLTSSRVEAQEDVGSAGSGEESPSSAVNQQPSKPSPAPEAPKSSARPPKWVWLSLLALFLVALLLVPLLLFNPLSPLVGDDIDIEIVVTNGELGYYASEGFTDQPPKEQWITYTAALADAAGYTPAAKQCTVKATESLPESRFEGLELDQSSSREGGDIASEIANEVRQG